MNKILLLLVMIFLHIVDDYYLQGWLASAKQKSYWEQNAPDKLYRYDYIMALFMHSFSWSFMVTIIPFIIVINIYPTNDLSSIVIGFFVVNLFIHMIADHYKANLKWINLIQDQLFHLAQIFAVWCFFIEKVII